MTTPDTISVSLENIRHVARAALLRAGCDTGNADAVAEVMVLAERDGCASHGLFRLPGYLASLKSGKVDGTARTSWTRLAPSVIQIDGHGGFAPVAMAAARTALSPIARDQGMGAAAIVNVHHFSALWVDIEPLVEQQLVALCCTAYLPTVAPAGGREPFFGTNPLAFGWPRAGGAVMVFDQASAAMSRGDLMLAARDGHPVPATTGVNAAGKPTTDPAEILKGAQLPFGGYKGSAIALMIELLSAALLGQPFSVEARDEDNRDGGPPRGGVLLIALDPSRFGDAAHWLAHSEAFFERMAGLDGVRLPGDRRAKNRLRIEQEGARLPVKLWLDAVISSGVSDPSAAGATGVHKR